MTHRDGGFYSAEDADSEGKEGKFYCWTITELKHLLTPDEFKVATRYFGITEEGNFVDHSDPNPLPNQNVLSIVDPKLSDAERKVLDSANKKMFDARTKRVRPHLDDKVLASWNGLMLGAIARSYAVLGGAQYRQAAETNLAFLQSHLWDAKTKTLYHRWRDGERDNVQLLDAYAYLLSGVLDLYEATLDPKHLQFAIDFADSMTDAVLRSERRRVLRKCSRCERPDHAHEGGLRWSRTVRQLRRLAGTVEAFGHHRQQAFQRCCRKNSPTFLGAPARVSTSRAAHAARARFPFARTQTRRARRERRQMLHAIHSVYQPNKVVLSNAGPVEEFAKTLPTKDAPVVFLCTGTACQPPTKDPKEVARTLKD